MVFISAASALVVDLSLCKHTDTEGNRERPESGIYFKILEKTQYLMNTLRISNLCYLKFSLEANFLWARQLLFTSYVRQLWIHHCLVFLNSTNSYILFPPRGLSSNSITKVFFLWKNACKIKQNGSYLHAFITTCFPLFFHRATCHLNGKAPIQGGGG